jgi:hypothetical protein
MLPKLKFGLSETLIEKLCLILHIFRKNDVPDDVFYYIINPFFSKIDATNVYTWIMEYKKFIGMMEYDYNFKIVLKDEWDHLDLTIVKYMTKYTHNDFYEKGVFGFTIILNECDVLHYVSYTKRNDNLPIYSLFQISNDDVNIYVCYTDFNNCKYDVNDDIVNDVIKKGYDAMYKEIYMLQVENINEAHLKLLKKKIDIEIVYDVDDNNP